MEKKYIKSGLTILLVMLLILTLGITTPYTYDVKYTNEKNNVYAADSSVSSTTENWIKQYGGDAYDTFYSVSSSPDGGYIAVGTSYSGNGDLAGNKGAFDFIIAKFDEHGNKVWIKNYGGDGEDSLKSVIPASGGGYIAVGYSYSANGDLLGNYGGGDFIIAKFGEDGNIVWIKNYDIVDYGRSNSFNSVVPAHDGGYIAVGKSGAEDGNTKRDEFAIAKFDENGDKEWIKIYGGSGDDYFSSVIPLSNGHYVAVGHSDSADGNVPGNNGSFDSIIAKLDANGTIIWIKNCGGGDDDYFRSVTLTPDGGYITVGESFSNDGDLPGNYGGRDFIIAKYDENGNRVWIKNYGGKNWDSFNSIISARDGGYMVVGESSSRDGDLTGNYGNNDYIIAKFDESGNKVWIKNHGNKNYNFFNSVIHSPHGGYIAVGGASKSEDLSGYYDFIIAKFDENGNLPFSESLPKKEEIQTYMVTFKDGSKTISAEKVASGNLIGEPAKPKKSGYTFIGWYTTNNHTAKFDFANTKITKDTVIYAYFGKNPAKVKAKTFKVSSPKKKQAKVAYKKVSKATGYEVVYGTKKSAVKKATKVTKKNKFYAGKKLKHTKKGLKSSKVYYFKVRAYKTIKGVKCYGGWTSVKKVKVK